MAMDTSAKKAVTQIATMEEDFPQWYTDIVKKAELVDYSPVKGCMVIRPNGYAIWEGIMGFLDTKFKETGHENVYMPLLIPESLLEVEKQHVEGFAPEVAWVTMGGSEQLTEKLCIRPTSEVHFCDHWSKTVESYNDLPRLYNQWCSVLRWEKTTRPFLRTMEFLWQEGHTIHATAEEAVEETLRMLDIYRQCYEDYMAIPVIPGRKTEKEKFAGARETYTVESMMKDGKALQAATSHYFGDGFAKAFNVRFTDKDGKLKNPHQTSWGLTTRSIGALIMVHGDNSGLVLPPRVAPTQVIIVPIAFHKEGVLEKAAELESSLKKAGIRVKTDKSEKSAGWKFAEHEMKGVPIRIEMGPRDIENNKCIAAIRYTGEKRELSLDNVEEEIKNLLAEIQEGMFEAARERMNTRIYTAENLEVLKTIAAEKPGFIKAAWCGDQECEERLKDEAGVSSRCILEEETPAEDAVCVCCGKKAQHTILWGKAY